MSVEKILLTRSQSKCELCSEEEGLRVYVVPPRFGGSADECAFVCGTCHEQIEDQAELDAQHWRCLNESMWSQVPAVQVIVWRILHRLRNEGWPQDLLGMLYLDEAIQSWAEEIGDGNKAENKVKHIDSNGSVLEAGDTVTLIKDLNVKGANFVAKRGTVVRGISIVSDNSEHIEGRVNGQHIVLLTKFVKKAG